MYHTAFINKLSEKTGANSTDVSIYEPELTSIPDYGFEYFTSISGHVDIGPQCTKIGYLAFSKCTNIESIAMSDSVIDIGGSAFEYMINLRHINLSKQLTEIKPYVFSFCKSLTDITIPSGVKQIHHYAFY